MVKKIMQWMCEILKGLVEITFERIKINMFNKNCPSITIKKLEINIDKLIITEKEIEKALQMSGQFPYVHFNAVETDKTTETEETP